MQLIDLLSQFNDKNQQVRALKTILSALEKEAATARHTLYTEWQKAYADPRMTNVLVFDRYTDEATFMADDVFNEMLKLR